MKKINDFIRVAAKVPKLRVGDIDFNIEEIKKEMHLSEQAGVSITLFPELAITSSTIDDMFQNSFILNKALQGLIELKNYTKKIQGGFIIGLPLRIINHIYNVIAVIENGAILGIIPSLEENRYFTSGRYLDETITIDSESVRVSPRLLFKKANYEEALFGVIINNDEYVSDYISKGATIILSASSTPRIIGNKESILSKLKYLTNTYNCAYIYASSSALESTTNYCYSPLAYIVENGDVLASDEELTFESKSVISDIDIEKLLYLQNNSQKIKENDAKYELIYYNGIDTNNILIREYEELPFVPKDTSTLEEILSIQAYALARRLAHLNCDKAVLGISGGLDSTLAFLVTVKAFDILKINHEGIIGITLPGFGTTDRTKDNAIKLIAEYGATGKEISIKEACLRHFKDIEHDKDIHDVTYENTQARERTQILLDYANKIGGIVIGTGDLSELALGWCTYNGDHMSNYSINASIPKTLVRHLVKQIADTETNELAKNILYDILDTPVSPELLPPSESGKILQETENVVGPYILHDFFIYHMLKYGASPKKLFFLAKHTFKDMSDAEIKKWLNVFICRFLTQQFKRNCSVDGPSIGSVSLSPHGGLILPSDISVELWKKEIEQL